MNRLFARLALVGGLIAVAFVLGAAPLYRYAGFELASAFELLRWGTYAALATVGIAVLWAIAAAVTRSGEGLMSLLLGVAFAAGGAYYPITSLMKSQSVPMIHDITTDTANPPPFVAIAPLRAGAPNGVDYKAEENVEKQQGAYADIQPLILADVAPADLFKRAEATARAMGWEIVAAEAAEGRIEATETTAWWGFKDDVVIRIAAEGAGSRLDIRSMSRVGKSDLGKNADRIRAFLAKVKEAK
jgi:uncharacterized protein (DUF1499 family)